MISQSGTKFNLLSGKNQASAQNIQRQLVIIDAKISNYQMLAAGVTPGTEVVILHPAEDGIEQITAILSGETIHESSSLPVSPSPRLPVSPSRSLPVSPAFWPPCSPASSTTIHIISHGQPGSLQLGNTTLNNHNLSRYASQLYQWRKTLGDSGNLILYGCSVAAGSQGLSFIQQLHRILGSGIAAATTPVGNAALGGSWNLEQIFPPSSLLEKEGEEWSGNISPLHPPLPFQPEVLQAYPGLFPASFPITDANWDTSVWNLGGAGGTPVWQAKPIPSTNPSDPYWLRLTPALTNRRGYAIYKEEFSSNDGIVVKFDYASYGGNGADGFSFFLVDADSNGDGVVNASDTVTIGKPPGGLGYASLPPDPIPATPPTSTSNNIGVTKGYVGIGFDEFGSFTRSDIGFGTDTAAGAEEWTTTGGYTVTTPNPVGDNVVAIRGSGNLWDGLNGYKLLAKNQISSLAGSPTIDGVVRSSPRKVQITLVNKFITVEMDFGLGFIEVLNIPNISTVNNLYTVNGAPPAWYKMGFGAATGGKTNVHEIRNLEISKPVDLSIIKQYDTLTSPTPPVIVTDTITYKVTVSNNDYNDVTGAQVFDDFTGIGITNLTWTLAGGATVSSSGTPGQFNPIVDLPKSSSVTFTVTGTVNQASLVSYATVTAPSNFRDVDETNNRDNEPIDVDATNDAPSLSDNAILTPGINEDAANPPGDTISNLFGSSFFDPDPGATLSGLAIVGNTANATTEGKWQYSTNSGTNWYDIGTVADGATALALSTTTKLRFLPALNYNGEPTVLTVRALDNTHSGFTNGTTRTTVNTSSNGNTTAISRVTKTLGTSVNPVNDAPSFTNNATLAAIPEDSTNPAGETVNNLFGSLFRDIVDAGSYFGGIAVVENTANATTEGKWQYFLSNGPSWYDIGTVADATALVLSTDTKIRFLPVSNYNGTPPALTVRALDDTYTGNFATYTSTSGLTTATVNAASPNNNGGTKAIAGTPNTLSTNVTAVNDAPVLDTTGSPSLTAIDEDVADASNSGTLVSAIIGSSITDVDTSALQGIAVTGADNTNGTWQYSTDSGSTWSAFGTLSDTSATLLNPTAKIRFVPNANYYGTVPNNITFRAWDQTSGTNGATGVNVSTNGGTTAFSTATETASITVNPINDAPLLTTTGSPSLTAIDEDVANASNSGTLVSAIIGSSITDVDTSALQGIAVTGANNTNGTWQYSIDNGGTWSAFGTLSDTSATLLNPTAKIRFVPAANYYGTVTNGITFRAWDQTSGTNGTTVDVSTNGNSTAFSTATDTASITVNPVNDIPSFTASDPLAVNQDAGPQTIPGWVTQFNPGPANESTQTALSYTVSNISNPGLFSSPPTVAANGQLTYTPATGVSGNSTFQVVVKDSGGTPGVDTSVAQTFTITVNSVNDAPVLTTTSPSLTPIDEDVADASNSGTLVSTIIGSSITDQDSGALQGIAVTGADNTNGTWQYSTDSGSTWIDFGTPSDGSATLLNPTAKIRFVPNADYYGTVTNGITFRAWDQTSGTNGTTVDVSTNGNSTAFSTATDTASITVNPVNDIPSFTAANPPAVNEDAGAQTISSWASGFNPGPANESGQTLVSYTVSNISNPGLFSSPPTVAANGQLTYTPAPGAFGTSTFQVVVKDSGGTPGVDTSVAQTFTITVNPPNPPTNNPPTSEDNTVAVTPGTPYTFKLADFPFNDVDLDPPASITITDFPGPGTLLLDGVPVTPTPGQPITISAQDIAKLTFTPAAGSSGTNPPSFQFTVSDGQGNSQPATMTLNVGGAVNNPPTSADKTITLNEDSSYSFLETDFAFTDTDGGNFTSIKITSLPTAGTLQLGTTAVNVNDPILKANIGTLKFTPAANANGTNYANFQFTVNDGTGDSTTPKTITLDVTPVNDKPSFAASDPAHVSFNAGAQNVQNWAIFNPGAANEVGQTGTYTVNPTSITNPGLFAVPPAVDANGNLTYTPAPGASGTSDFQVVVKDDGGTANGGEDTSDSQTFTITVHPADAPANNAPNFTGNATLTPPVAENSTDPPSATVSNLFGGLFDDPDAGDSLSGIAVVGNTADPVTEGSWQYSPDGINWFDIGTVGDGPNALALSATSFIRFLPVPGYNGTPQPLTVRAVDNTYTGGFSGLNRANIDTSNAGGNSPIAGSTNTIATSVAAVVNGTDNNDTLDGGDGNDAITGGPGNDSLTGNDGDDAIDGGDGQDTISGGPGNDSLSGSNDNDTISGGDNNDTVSGGNGDDSLDGGTGDDSLTGGDGDDTLIGGGGGDTLSGGNNDDVYVVDLGNAPGTVISDASGDDKLVLTGGTLTLDEPPGVQVIRQDNNLVVDLNGNGVQDDDADIVVVDFFDPEGSPGSGFIEDLGNLSGSDVVNSLGGTTPPPPTGQPSATGLVTPATPIATANDSQASPDIVAPEMDCTAPEIDCTCPTIPPPPTVSYEVPPMDPSLVGDDVILGNGGSDELCGYTGNDYLQGNGGNDIIIGGNGSEQPIGASGDQDIIFGNPGHDILQGSEGGDIIYSGQDDDVAHGGKDDDLMYGDRGSDILMGDLGNDVMFGGPAEPELADQDATDYIYGGAGDDFLNGNRGNDFLSGGVGNDIIYGGQDNDVARGEEGNDLLFGDKGNDTFCGGDGNDTLYGGTGSDIGIGDSGEQDKLLGGAGNDFINGNEGKDTICGGDGNDTIYGGKDNDIARGEEGNDLLFGDRGNDTFSGGDGDDTLYGGTGSDIGIGDSGEQDKLLGGAGNDFINGNEGKDTICGGDGNDTIYGGKDDDLINGSAGDDLILGDLGNDTLIGGDGRDTFVLRAGAGSDIIIDFTDGVDFLGLSGGLSFADLSITGDTNATLIKFGDEVLATLGGVNFSLINDADFSLV